MKIIIEHETLHAETPDATLARAILDLIAPNVPVVTTHEESVQASNKLTDARIASLLGDTSNLVYFNYDAGEWNRNRYNDYNILGQDTDTRRAKEFKSKIEKRNPDYELVVMAVMTISKKDYPGWKKTIKNPKYSENGSGVVGNIILRNRKTGELVAGNSWVGVNDYYNPNVAVRNGAYWFAYLGARDSVFLAAVVAGLFGEMPEARN